jgi:riboflavin kinase/FMN adenylyltransferase
VRIHTDFSHIENIDNAVVTIGAFDGVHKGHQRIIDQVKATAKSIGGNSVVITFNPHPRTVVSPQDKFQLISTHLEKVDRFYYTGIDHLVVVNFTQDFAKLTADEFTKKYLFDKLKTSVLVIGYDLHIGSDRMGSVEGFKELGLKYNFKVEEIDRLDIDSATVSSTNIRSALETGNVSMANDLLGYPYHIYGRVVYGNQIGHKIGFPTANIEIKDEKKLLPCNGVYAVTAYWNGRLYGGMANIGIRPTISHSNLTLEVHLFNFDRNIYLDYTTINFICRLRDEKRFNGLDELSAQLALDKINAYEALQDLDLYNSTD